MHVPVLHAAELGERETPGGILEGVLVDPAESGRVGAKGRDHRGGELAGDSVEIFQHATAGPVEVGAVLEDHVHERDAEERVAAHRARTRHLEHSRRDRIGDLILDDTRRLIVVLGLHDHLHVAEVGERLEGRAL